LIGAGEHRPVACVGSCQNQGLTRSRSRSSILHLLGFDHEKLTYRYAGRDHRLTDVFGNVVKGILAWRVYGNL